MRVSDPPVALPELGPYYGDGLVVLQRGVPGLPWRAVLGHARHVPEQEDVLLVLLVLHPVLRPDGLLGLPVAAGEVHSGGYRGRRGGEYLDLFGHVVQFVGTESEKLAHMPVLASRVGRHQIVCEVQVPVLLFLEPVEQRLEIQQFVLPGLAHQLQDVVRDVFRSDLHLSGDVAVADQGAHVLLPVLLVSKYEVVSDTRCYEDVFHIWYLRDPLQQFDLPAVVHGHESAYLGVHASLVHARTELLLLGALEAVHVGRRPSHIPEYAVESGFGCYLLGLP